jgi:hypothetical protein
VNHMRTPTIPTTEILDRTARSDERGGEMRS